MINKIKLDESKAAQAKKVIEDNHSELKKVANEEAKIEVTHEEYKITKANKKLNFFIIGAVIIVIFLILIIYDSINTQTQTSEPINSIVDIVNYFPVFR